MKYKGFDHTNTTDDEENVLEITSTEAEVKRIVAVNIIKETNAGKLKFYIERENLFEENTYHKTAQWSTYYPLRFIINEELDIGKTFRITLQNVTAGTNAELVGYVEYEIV